MYTTSLCTGLIGIIVPAAVHSYLDVDNAFKVLWITNAHLSPFWFSILRKRCISYDEADECGCRCRKVVLLTVAQSLSTITVDNDQKEYWRFWSYLLRRWLNVCRHPLNQNFSSNDYTRESLSSRSSESCEVKDFENLVLFRVATPLHALNWYPPYPFQKSGYDTTKNMNMILCLCNLWWLCLHWSKM